MKRILKLSRRSFIKGTLAAGTAFTIVPRHVLGGSEKPPPSETLGGALIGVGGRGPGTWNDMAKSLEGVGLGLTKLADCDVRWRDRADLPGLVVDGDPITPAALEIEQPRMMPVVLMIRHRLTVQAPCDAMLLEGVA